MDRVQKFIPSIPSIPTIPLQVGDVRLPFHHAGNPAENYILPSDELVGRPIIVNGKNLIVEKLIAAGGFAEVFLVRAVPSNQPLALKRVFAQDPEVIDAVTKEIAFMKQVGSHPKIVQVYETVKMANRRPVTFLILMEYCESSMVEYLNGRMRNRLNDQEVLRVFSEICEAVAFLHYQDPPIIHRDLKIENILLGRQGVKLCDFGSATTNPLRVTNIKDVPIYEAEIQKYTTLAYRSPEMVDLYQKKTIDEKADIWALGCLLYFLCYYKSPFEDSGQLAILGAKYSFPESPPYSSNIKNMIAYMLVIDPDNRPNIYEVTEKVFTLLNKPCPIQNIYTDRPISNNSPSPQSSPAVQHEPQVVHHTPQVYQPQREITPMRRGRNRDAPQSQPTIQQQQQQPRPQMQQQQPARVFSSGSAPSSSPISPAFSASDQLFDPRNDPFAASAAPNSNSANNVEFNAHNDPFAASSDPFANKTSDPFAASNDLFASAPKTNDPFAAPNDPFATKNPDPFPAKISDPFAASNDLFASSSAPTSSPHSRSGSTGITNDPFSQPADLFAANSDPFGSRSSSKSGNNDPFSANSDPFSQPQPQPQQAHLPQHLNIPTQSHPAPVSTPTRSGSESNTPITPGMVSLNINARGPPAHTSTPREEKKPKEKRMYASEKRNLWLQKLITQRISQRSMARKIVGETWRLSNEESMVGWIINEINTNKMLPSQDFQANLNAVYLFHKIISEGPPTVLKEFIQKQQFIENIKATFAAQVKKEKVYSRRIAKYGELILKKLAFHEKHPEFEGTFSLQSFFHNFQKNPKKITFLSAETIKELTDLYLDSEELREVSVESSLMLDNIFFLMNSALFEEFYQIYTITLHLLSKMKDLPQFNNDMFTMNTRLTRFYTSFTQYVESVKVYSNNCPFTLPSIPQIPSPNLDKPPYNFPPSTGGKHLFRLSKLGIDISKLPISEVYLANVKEAATQNRNDVMLKPFPGARYESAISSDSD